MSDTPEQPKLIRICTGPHGDGCWIGAKPGDRCPMECDCEGMWFVPEPESINKAELVEWLEERQKPPPLALDFGESEQWEARHSALQAVLDHINESEGQ